MNSKNIRIAICTLLILSFGNAIHRHLTAQDGSPETVSASAAMVIEAKTRMIFTCSEDGTTLYRWQYHPKSMSEPKYLGKTNAVLSE